MTELQYLEKQKELLLTEISMMDLRISTLKGQGEKTNSDDSKTPIRMLTIKEAASEAGLSYEFTRKLCIQKKISFVKVGNKTLINWTSLENYLKTGGGVN